MRLKEANDEIVALSRGYGSRPAQHRNVLGAPVQALRVEEAVLEDGQAESDSDPLEAVAPFEYRQQ